MLTFEQQQIESNHISFLQAFNKELAKQIFMHVDTQELNDSEKVSAIWFENHKIIVKKMNSIKPSMVDMKPKNAIKLDIVELDKFETYPEEIYYLKMVYADIYIGLVNNIHMKGALLTSCGVKIYIGYIEL